MDRGILEEVIDTARAAGGEVLEVYVQGCTAETKHDGSPVTEADHRSQAVICKLLAEIAPDVPIVAEEDGRAGTSADGRAGEPDRRAGTGADGRAGEPDRGARAGEPAPDGRFWLVDPLDGTKEFLGHNDEFTINIALIAGGAPVLGVVFAPALGRLFAAAAGSGATVDDAAGRRVVSVRSTPREGATVVSSRAHGDRAALARFTAGRRIAASITAGSSLKFCLLAEGQADLYPRFGRTMEWDTAAGDAVLRAAGGRVTDLAGQPLQYGKPGFENPHFVAFGRDDGSG